MGRILKGSSVIFVVFIALALSSLKISVRANYNNYLYPSWSFLSFSNKLNLLTDLPASPLQPGDILVEDFESFWEEGNYHRWTMESESPVYGFGLGYDTIFETVLDSNKGSRVLDVYRPPSIFLPSTPYEGHAISFDLSTLPDTNADGISMATNDSISFDLRVPLDIELGDIFELYVTGENGDNVITVCILPLEPSAEECIGPLISTENMYGMTAAVTGFNPAGQLQVSIALGHDMLDGSWHAVWVDLDEAVRAAVDVFDDIDGTDKADWYMEKACAVAVSGRMFRLDNIIFRANKSKKLHYAPHLFKIGPRFADIFEPYRYLFCADYGTGDHHISSIYDFLINDDFPNLFITDPNEIARVWITEFGADPDLFGSSADPKVSAAMGREFVVDPKLPLFANPNFRLGKNPALKYIPGTKLNKTLEWNINASDPSTQGTGPFVVSPLEIDPYDGMPTYIPVFYEIKKVLELYGKTFFGPVECYNLESALWNAGFTSWTNIAKLDFKPQMFEDFFLTIDVSNGEYSDSETFPIFVVNYPIENHPPIIWRVENLLFYTGESNTYVFSAVDPDCMIFSMSGSPASTHKSGISEDFRTDMDGIYWEFLNPFDLGCYCTINDVLDHTTGVLQWVPKFRGIHSGLILGARDPYGIYGITKLNLFCISKGTFLNHPPIILRRPTELLTIKAGDEYILYPTDFSVEDPDGDTVYASCNIGSCRRGHDGYYIWRFLTHFPGLYTVEIIFYDIHGGYSSMEFQVDVEPWWSY